MSLVFRDSVFFVIFFFNLFFPSSCFPDFFTCAYITRSRLTVKGLVPETCTVRCSLVVCNSFSFSWPSQRRFHHLTDSLGKLYSGKFRDKQIVVWTGSRNCKECIRRRIWFWFQWCCLSVCKRLHKTGLKEWLENGTQLKNATVELLVPNR